MRNEVLSAADFLTNMLRVKDNINNIKLDLKQLEQFNYILQDKLMLHYQAHWFPSNPNKGSGYRCIRINHKMDPILKKAGLESGFPEEVLRERFPNELTLWIDPKEVSYRIGENGSICVLYDGTVTTDNRRTTPTSSLDCLRNCIGHLSMSNSPDESYSPMSISPPTPGFEHRGSCKSEFSFNTGFIMENRNGSFVEYVSS